jgi:hypothetical protein
MFQLPRISKHLFEQNIARPFATRERTRKSFFGDVRGLVAAACNPS